MRLCSSLVLASGLCLLFIIVPPFASALVIGRNDGTIVTVDTLVGDGEIVVRDIGSNQFTHTLDDDSHNAVDRPTQYTDWSPICAGGARVCYSKIAGYNGDGSEDDGSIITIDFLSGRLMMVDLLSDTASVLDDDWDWNTTGNPNSDQYGLYRGIAGYSGDGTEDNGMIVTINASGNLVARDLFGNHNIVLDDDLNFIQKGDFRGIASYTGDYTKDTGTILFTGAPVGGNFSQDVLFIYDLSKNVGANNPKIIDTDLNWSHGGARGIASYDPVVAIPEPQTALLIALGLCGLAARARSVRT